MPDLDVISTDRRIDASFIARIDLTGPLGRHAGEILNAMRNRFIAHATIQLFASGNVRAAEPLNRETRQRIRDFLAGFVAGVLVERGGR